MPASATRPFAIVTHALPEGWLALLESRCELLAGPADAAALAPELQARLREAEGLFTLLTVRVDEALLQGAPRLRVVSNMAVGVDNIDLAAARHLPEASRDAREGRWTTWSPTGWLGADLQGATLGIVGMGKIGQAVAARARGFGLRLLYADQHARPEVEDPLQGAEESLGAQRAELADLLEHSDFVSLHVTLTSETRHLVNEQTLRAMKPTALLVNTARGGVVDTAALVRALSEGWIGGAALDVTDPEPLPPGHPLYSFPNCLIVPHIGSATVGARRRMAELACENLLAGLEGRPLLHCANPEVYRK